MEGLAQGMDGGDLNVIHSSVSGHMESHDGHRTRKKRRTMKNSVTARLENLESDCSQLIEELEDLEKEVVDDYHRHHWFRGIRILVNRPIHSS